METISNADIKKYFKAQYLTTPKKRKKEKRKKEKTILESEIKHLQTARYLSVARPIVR